MRLAGAFSLTISTGDECKPDGSSTMYNAYTVAGIGVPPKCIFTKDNGYINVGIDAGKSFRFYGGAEDYNVVCCGVFWSGSCERGTECHDLPNFPTPANSPLKFPVG